MFNESKQFELYVTDDVTFTGPSVSNAHTSWRCSSRKKDVLAKYYRERWRRIELLLYADTLWMTIMTNANR